MGGGDGGGAEKGGRRDSAGASLGMGLGLGLGLGLSLQYEHEPKPGREIWKGRRVFPSKRTRMGRRAEEGLSRMTWKGREGPRG